MIIGTLVVVLLPLACAKQDGGPERHESADDRPLVAVWVATHGPPQPPEDQTTPWSASFVISQLCNREPKNPIILDKVTYEAEVEPLDVTVNVRTVVPQEDGSPILDRGWFRGHPPDFEGHQDPPPGDYSTDVAGAEITHGCDSEEEGPGDRRRDLFVTVESDEAGSYLSRVSVHYHTQDGDHYILEPPSLMLACGTDVPDRVDEERVCPS